MTVPLGEKGDGRALRAARRTAVVLDHLHHRLGGALQFADDEAAASHGERLPDLLVPLSGGMALVGGLSVLLGYRTRFGALLLVIFLVPMTVVMHNFWERPMR
jgi:uncharacterized membrane protein YphA (DoxX/SURF4 family)